MKLIIDISEGSYNTIKECYERGELLTTICMQIATGIPYEERPHGEWEYTQYDGNPNIGNWHCSECKHIVTGMYISKPEDNFCPFCGADMRGNRRMSKSKKKCEFPNEEYVHSCPYSLNFRDIRCTWYDGECPRYSKKEGKKNDT